jgi:hypothetical protein
LSGWGARYTKKKARREVADFASLRTGKAARCTAFVNGSLTLWRNDGAGNDVVRIVLVS